MRPVQAAFWRAYGLAQFCERSWPACVLFGLRAAWTAHVDERRLAR